MAGEGQETSSWRVLGVGVLHMKRKTWDESRGSIGHARECVTLNLSIKLPLFPAGAALAQRWSLPANALARDHHLGTGGEREGVCVYTENGRVYVNVHGGRARKEAAKTSPRQEVNPGYPWLVIE